MTVVYVDVRHQEMLARPLFGGKLTSPEALSNYVRARWPEGTAKHVAREWDLSLDEAKGVVAARASRATLDKVFQPERGGWPVALCVLAGVIGQGVAEFFAAEAAKAREEAEHARQQAEALTHAERLAIRSFAPALVPARAAVGAGLASDHRRHDLSGRPDATALGRDTAGEDLADQSIRSGKAREA